MPGNLLARAMLAVAFGTIAATCGAVLILRYRRGLAKRWHLALGIVSAVTGVAVVGIVLATLADNWVFFHQLSR